MLALKLVDKLLSQMDAYTAEQKSEIIEGCNIARLCTLGTILDSWIKNGKFAGVSAAVFRNNSLVYETYKGVLDLDTQKPINKDTLFRCYSMTKPITAVALMMLYEEGKFKLDDPISKYIPNFSDMPVYDYDCKENKELKPIDMKLDNVKTKHCTVPILIKHLLTHTSGLCYGYDTSGELEPVDRIALNYFQFHSQKDLPLSEVIDNKLTKIPLCFEPGTHFNYSFSSDVCGRLIEILSGMKLNEFFHKRIFEPLKMTNTAFYIDGPYNKLDVNNLATLYNPSYDGKPPNEVTEDEFENYKLIKNKDDQEQGIRLDFQHKGKGANMSGGGSKGGVISTLDNYMTFCKMLLNDGKCMETGTRILLPKTIRLMTQNHLPNNETVKKCMIERSFLKNTFPDGFGYGLGFGVIMENKHLPKDTKNSFFNKGTFYWGGTSHLSFFWVDPVEKLCTVLMTQNIGVNGMKFDWRTQIEKSVYQSLVK